MYFEIIDFDLLELSEDCILARYIIKKSYLKDKVIKHSNRSSVWKCTEEKWEMIFHQGTQNSL